MKNNSGISTIIAVLLGLFIIGVAGYFVVMNLNSSNTSTPQPQELTAPTPSPVSEADDVDTLEAELKQTTTGSLDEDFEILDSEASSL